MMAVTDNYANNSINVNMWLLVWIWICTLQGPFLAIFAMELGERSANIYKKKMLRRKNSLCGSILPSLFQIFKNWLKRVSALTAYVWGASPL